MRPTAAQRGYNSAWQKCRAGHLLKNPYCVRCGKIASVVDHIKPHKRDQALFWDPDNRQSLCQNCHNSYKQRLEKSGRVIGCDVNGFPVDPQHHWRKPSLEVAPSRVR
ncbi:MAG: HNH endonuclease [Nitrosospira sp.]|nr:HNH endonuclease [Nitrosospira sp.]